MAYCRSRYYHHLESHIEREVRIKAAYCIATIGPLYSAMTGFLLATGIYKNTHRATLFIIFASTSASVANALYLKPSNIETCLAHRDGAQAYQELEARLGGVRAKYPASDPEFLDRYRNCIKKRMRLDVKYYCLSE